MAQYIEHPALRGIEMGNRASQQRMNIYGQAVSQATEALNKAAAERQRQWYQLQQDRAALKAGLTPRTYQPLGVKPPLDYGLDFEQALLSQQFGAEGVNPQTLGRYGAPQTGAGEVPFTPSKEAQMPAPVGFGYKAIGPSEMEKIMTMPTYSEPSFINSILESAGLGPSKPGQARQQVKREAVKDPRKPAKP